MASLNQGLLANIQIFGQAPDYIPQCKCFLMNVLVDEVDFFSVFLS